MRLELRREVDTGVSTSGSLYADGEFIAFTLENTWKDNKRSISCVPPGCYDMKAKEYGRFWDKFQTPIPMLQNVDGRSEILIHPGNYAKDTFGCILVGDSKGVNAVWNSRRTWNFILPTLQSATEITIYEANAKQDNKKDLDREDD